MYQQRTKKILALAKSQVDESENIQKSKNLQELQKLEYRISKDKDNTKYNINVKKVNIISHWLLGKTEPKCIDMPDLNVINTDKAGCDDHHILDNCVKTDNFAIVTTASSDSDADKEIVGFSNCLLPLVVVPPKEAVEHLLVTDDVPIIIEDVSDISKNTENQYAKDFVERVLEHINSEDNTNIYSDDSDNKFDTCYNTSSDNSEVTPISRQDEVGIDQRESLGQIVNSIDKGLNETSNEIEKSIKYLSSGENEKDVEFTNKKHYKDKKTFCCYCVKDVSHFSRHLSTWHKNEIEVQRILSYNFKSKERRHAISVLGKRGNFIRNRSTVQMRPVKRVKSDSGSSPDEFLPCPHCLGFYKKKSLYRHTKQCKSRPKLVNVNRQHAQSDGQTALLMLFNHHELLKKELFPRMRADEISLLAKKDSLICNYAYSYIKGRRSKGNIDIVRQNIRRLAKLLQYAKEENNEINGLIDLLRPTLFQIIINGVNKIGKYNEDTDIYESPTVAINFGTLIKKCCDLAILQLLQKPNTQDRRKELKILKTLVESQWANEISAQAGANLNEKKWNKEELLPLTSDLKKLKDYLETVSMTVFENLQLDEKNQEAYNTLKEVVYCQIILINRRRPAEVAQLKVKTYKSINLATQENEFESCLTETEKILLKSCDRIVIRGKRGRGVPILLLTPNMRKYFDILLKVRNNFVENNEYIFHTDGKSFIDGTKVLYKYALKCGVDNPKCISATKLRKHLATVTQLLQFSTDDLEQLSRFMGHTLKTHCDFYRLSDSTYQTAKLSKLLLLATDGGLEKFKGMRLDDIDIDLNPITEECILQDLKTEDLMSCEDNEDFHEECIPSTEIENVNASDKKNVSSKQSWSCSQKKIINEYFIEHIENKQAPKRHEIKKFVAQYPELFHNRKWTSIKAVVYNIYSGKLLVPP